MRLALRAASRSKAAFVTGLLVGLLLVAPVGAHVTRNVAHLWNLRPKVAGVVNSRVRPERMRVVGAARQPAFLDGWSAFSTDPVRFYKDAFGVVHIEGGVTRTSGRSRTIFVLPRGYRPSREQELPVTSYGGKFAEMVLTPDGRVQIAPEADIASSRSMASLIEGAELRQKQEARAACAMLFVRLFDADPFDARVATGIRENGRSRVIRRDDED